MTKGKTSVGSPSVARYAELEAWGYSTDVIAFLGLSVLRGMGFSALRNVGGPLGFADQLRNYPILDLVQLSQRNRAKSTNRAKISVSRGESRETLTKRGLAVAKDLIRLRIRFLTSADLPTSVRRLPRELQPLWLFAQGDVRLLQTKSIAVVGTRHPTSVGEFLTRYVVSMIRDIDAPVVSGLAHGIDTIAHEWCLEVGLPTVSVLGGGLLALYPAKNRDLASRIVGHGGLLISEYFPNQPATAANFVSRNRLQAGFAAAVVATEWKTISGTAHTIRFAAKFGRPSVSVRLSQSTSPPDAGTAQFNIDIPHQHGLLMNILADARDNHAAGSHSRPL